MMAKSSFRPVERAMDSPLGTSSVRLIPSGVSSNAHAITNAIGNPAATSAIKTFITHAGASKAGKRIEAS